MNHLQCNRSRPWRPTSRATVLTAAALAFLSARSRSQEIDLKPAAGKAAQSLGAKIFEQISDIELPRAFDADASQTALLQSKDGTIQVALLPATLLNDDPENPYFNSERGVAVAYLALKGVCPAEAAQRRDQLYALRADEGTAMVVGILSVQRLSGSEYRLVLWGKGEAPLAAVPLFASAGSGDLVALRYWPGLIECTWMGKYRAFLPVDHDARR